MVTLRKVELDEAGLLLDFSKKTFYDFFAHLNEPANIEAYALVAFTPQKMQEELSNPNSEFYFAMLNGQVAGYLKLNFADAQTEFRDEKALEVERIYVSGEHHGKHIGRQFLNFAVDTAINRQLDYVWLGVWDHNHKAIGFYLHHGFEVFSSHEFLLGNDRQIDLLMRRML
jgi:ribosomal protein S18 acetylase RimI-like enzyme